MFLKVIGQVQEGMPLQVMAVTEDDQQTLLLHKQKHVYTLRNIMHSWPLIITPDVYP